MFLRFKVAIDVILYMNEPTYYVSSMWVNEEIRLQHGGLDIMTTGEGKDLEEFSVNRDKARVI